MSEVEKDKEREYRISVEVIVDACELEEQALGWYYYLEERGQPHSLEVKKEVLK